jgi:transposase-like protein
LIVNETSNSESDKKTISPEQTQYKTIQEKTVDGDKIYTLVNVDDDSGRSLAESIQNLGPIAPIYYMVDGVTLVDGRHRLAEAPNAQYTKIILKDCDTEVKRIIYDMVLNCNRRKVTPEEYRQKITLLAESGLSVKEIAAKIGLGHTLVDKYYPKPLKQQGHSLDGIASGKARALKAEQQETPAIASSAPMTSTMAPSTNLLSDVDIEKEPDVICAEFVPFAEQNQTQESTNEEKINALNAEADNEQQQLEKLICDAKADLPNDFKNAVYDLAFNPAKELTQKRLNDCLTVSLEVLLTFLEQEGKLQELLKTASERW